jgi:hypothetical protein
MGGAHGAGRWVVASGYFPLEADEPEGKRVLAAADEIQAVLDEMRRYVYEDSYQFDNAADDGQSLAMLGLALKLIRAEVRGPSGPRGGHDA